MTYDDAASRHYDGARQPRIAVVIVTYNSADVLGDCLRSLTIQDVHLTAVAVADHASRDDSLAIANAASDLPVLPIQMGRNAGYAAAVNAGLAALTTSKPDAFFVANYLILSSQNVAAPGSSSFLVYDRTTNAFVKEFRVVNGSAADDCDRTDGLEAYAGDLGPLFPNGLFVCQDGPNVAPGSGGNQNFKFVPFERVVAA